MRLLVVLLLVFGLPLHVYAKASSKDDQAINLKSKPSEFPSVVERIRAGMESGGRYQKVTSNDRQLVEQDLSKMNDILSGVQSIDELPTERKLDLINAQGRVNALLLANDDNRLICQKSQTIGTHMKKVNCATVAERRKVRERSQNMLFQQQQIVPIRRPGD